MENIQNLIVGCGLSGVVLAERISNILNEQVVVIERRNHIGGNVFDYDYGGITVHKYGPHAFHTNIKRIWNYLHNFTDFYHFNLKVAAYIDGNTVPVPFNINSIIKLFPQNLAERLIDKLILRYGYNKKISILELKKEDDEDLQFISDYIYKNVFEGYTIKQWGCSPENIDASVINRVKINISRDDRYFQDKYQGIPISGYTNMINNMLNNPKIKILLNTEYAEIKKYVKYNNLFFTGSIDEYFEYRYGELPYRSLYFDIIDRPYGSEQETATINYPTNYDWTRVCEHRHFLNQHQNHTVLSYEYPQQFEIGKNERYYPISNYDNNFLYDVYYQQAKNIKNTYFLGRLGDYKYYNMDQCIQRALDVFEFLK